MKRRRSGCYLTILLTATSAWAVAVDCEIQHLLDADSGGLGFAYRMVIGGDRCLVASSGADGRGVAFVLERAASDEPWIQVAALRASDGEQGDGFGSAVGLDGDHAFVGAIWWEGTGAVYEFTYDGEEWRQTARLDGDGATLGAMFGNSLAVDAETMVVGAPRDDVRGSDDGAVFVFERGEGGGWSQVARLGAGDGDAGDKLGWSVNLEGDLVVAGAIGHPLIDEPGAVYVFERDEEQWVQRQKLMAADRTCDDELGRDVGIVGNTIFAGAATHPNDEQSGAVYIFERAEPGEPFVEAHKLVLDDPQPEGLFGERLDGRDGRVLIGSRGRLGFRGAAYVLDRDETGAWSMTAELTASDGEPVDHLGMDALLGDDGTAMVGAIFDDNENGVDAGSAYVFDLAVCACAEDVDRDGVVGFDDLLTVLAAWGDAGGPADIDGSGVVDFDDVLAVLTAWGPCG